MTSPQQKNWNKDYYGGALLVILGVSAAYAANSYNLGSLAHMGPGYFPFAIGVLIAICGVLLGPVLLADGEHRSMLRTSAHEGVALVAAAKAVQARRTAHKDDGSLRVRVDPAVL